MKTGERLTWGAVVLLAFLAGWLLRPGGDGKHASPSEAVADAPRARPSPPVPRRETKPAAEPVPSPVDRSPAAIAEFAKRTLNEPNRVDRFAALAGLLENLTIENWRSVKDEFTRQAKELGRHHHQEWSLFLQRAGEVAGPEVVADMFESERTKGLRSALTGWAVTDPEAAVDWLETVPDPALRDEVWGAAVSGIAQTKPDLALRLLDELPVDDRSEYAQNLMRTIVQTVPLEEASGIFDAAVQRAEANGELDGQYLVYLFRQLAYKRLHNADQIPGGADWAARHLGQPYAEEDFVGRVAGHLVRGDPEEALQWLDRATDNQPTDDDYQQLVNQWVEHHTENDVAEWLDANERDERYDLIVTSFVNRIADTDIDAAIDWASTMRDAETREHVVRVLRSAREQLAERELQRRP